MTGPLARANPRRWPVTTLGRLVERRKDTGRPELPPLSVFLDDGVVPRESRADNHNVLGADLSKYLVVEPGDIVFNKLRTWQGGLGASRYEGLVSPAYFVCRPDGRSVPRYLHYLLRSTPYLAELTRLSKFMPPSQFDIAWQDLRLLPVALPSVENQRRIADFLDRETARLDALVEAQTELIAALRVRESVLRSSTLCATSIEEPVTRRRLKHLASVAYGDSLSSDHRVPGKISVYGSNGPVGEHDLANTKAPVLVVGRKGSFGKVHYSQDPVFAIDTTFFIDSFAESVDPKWLFHALTDAGLDEVSADVGVPGLSGPKLRNTELYLPPLAEQRRIADFLDAETAKIDALIAKAEEFIEVAKERRSALITAAVTGQIDVKEMVA